jgi:LPXTG-site transpeptidase (sortase) family protein
VRKVVGMAGTALILLSVAGLALLAAGTSDDPVDLSPVVGSPSDQETPATWTSAAPDASPTPAAVSATPTAEPTEPMLPTLLDEHFADNRMSWRDDRSSTTWFEVGTYRLAPQIPGQFVAIAAPVSVPLRDVVMTARFHKVGGPPGGGYGLILRDQEPTARDGVRQTGRYYVLEVGDRGQIGVWRRDEDHWVELLPWTSSDVVHPGNEPNELEAWASGPRLTLLVNGVQVASRVDDALASGGVGVFVGGDGNDVALERLSVRAPVDASRGQLFSATPTPRAEPTATPSPRPFRPITHVAIPSIALDADAVPASLVDKNDGLTWEVPPFSVGHAQNTAGAGGKGNAVLLGHVSSRHLGNVFEKLHAVQVGDEVRVFSGEERSAYRVAEVRTVARTDTSVVQPTSTPTLTLITCTGTWLPLVADYAERVVVRAELVGTE